MTSNDQFGQEQNISPNSTYICILFSILIIILYYHNPIFSGKKPKKFKIKKPPRSSRSSKVSRPPELAKSSAGDDPNMDASDLNDEEIEVSAFLHDFCTCTIAN